MKILKIDIGDVPWQEQPEHPFQVKGNHDIIVELTPAEKSDE